MLNELFPKTEQNTENQQQLVENRASFKKWEENISTIRSLIKDSNLYVGITEDYCCCVQWSTSYQ